MSLMVNNTMDYSICRHRVPQFEWYRKRRQLAIRKVQNEALIRVHSAAATATAV